MNSHEWNPAANRLPPGIKEDQLTKSVAESGYPLQTIVAKTLSAAGFEVSEEWGYVDRTTNEHRSLDIAAWKRAGSVEPKPVPYVSLLVECKRSQFPYVFFAAAVPKIPDDFPVFAGLPQPCEMHTTNGYREISPARLLCVKDFSFLTTPPLATSVARIEPKKNAIELTGAVPFNSVAMPLASAQEHYVQLWEDVKAAPRVCSLHRSDRCGNDGSSRHTGGT